MTVVVSVLIGLVVVRAGAVPRRLDSGSPGRSDRRLPSLRRARRSRASLPLVLELLARELRSGATVPTALATIAATEPQAHALVGAVERIGHGSAIGDELDRWGRSLHPDDGPLVRSVLRLGIATGAALADALDRVAATIRERIELDEELRALSAQSRASAVMVATAPLLFLAVVAVVDPASAAVLVTTPLGWLCLLVGVSLDMLGFVWMQRLVDRVTR